MIKHYSFGIFNTTFGIWHSYLGYDAISDEQVLAFEDNIVTKHSGKFMKWEYQKDMNRLFYKDDVKKETIFKKLLKFFKGCFNV